MTIGTRSLLAGAGLLALLTTGCGPDASETGELDVADVCEAVVREDGGVRAQNSWEENRAFVAERVEFFTDVAAVAEQQDAPASVAETATELARRFESVVDAPSHEELLIALTDVMTDDEVLALGRDLDTWFLDVCPDDSR